MQRLTDATIRAAEPRRGQYTIWDATQRGFGLRVSSGGAKTFTVMHGRNRERITVGRYPDISLAKAREKARQIIASRILQGDRLPDIKFDAAQQIFFAYQRQKSKASTVAEYERIFKRHLLPKFRHKNLADIKPHDIIRIIDRLLKTPSECSHVFSLALTFFRWFSTSVRRNRRGR